MAAMGLIDLHLGQKPKLGGRYAYTDISLIFCYHIMSDSLYIHVLFSFSCSFLCLFYFLKTPKDQKYFCYFSILLLLLFRIVLYFASLIFGSILKTQKDFLCLFVSFLLCFKIENQKIFVALLVFCIVFPESTAVRDSTWGLVFISYHSSHVSERQ